MNKIFVSTAIMSFLFVLCASAQDNNQIVCWSDDSLRVEMNLNKKAIPFWMPSPAQFRLLVENVQIVIEHEDTYDTSLDAKEERQVFLSTLHLWADSTYKMMASIVNGSGYKDLYFYKKRLPELTRFSDLGNFLELQAELLKCWEKHGMNIKPFWNEEIYDRYLASLKPIQIAEPN